MIRQLALPVAVAPSRARVVARANGPRRGRRLATSRARRRARATRDDVEDGADVPEGVADAFASATTRETRAAIARNTDVDALRASRDAAKAALAKAELAYAAATLAREASRDDDDDVEFSCSYGYIASLRGCYIDIERHGVPRGFLQSGTENFARELREMMAYFDANTPETEKARDAMPAELRAKMDALRLDADAIWARERARPEISAPWILKVPYVALCVMLDKLFDETQPVQRFWFLETVARMPYFSYTSMLTFYEILGWWRRSSELRKVHFAEEWNEYHHLLVMESLGGDACWRDRFLGQHAAIVYYFVLVALWLISPALAYNFSELIEGHAVDTYGQFVDQNAELLKSMPAPRIAVEYYEAADLYLFDEFQTAREVCSRRPQIRSLFDVFSNIRDDEGEHVNTMNACQREDSDISSPNAVNAKTAAIAALIAAQYAFQKIAETALMADEVAIDVDAVMDEKVAVGVFDAILRLFDFL